MSIGYEGVALREDLVISLGPVLQPSSSVLAQQSTAATGSAIAPEPQTKWAPLYDRQNL
jgi:hypothetical protein